MNSLNVKLKVSLSLLIIISLYWLGYYLSPAKPVKIKDKEIEQLIISNFGKEYKIISHKKPIPYYEIRDLSSNIKGYILYTEELKTTKQGFGGKLPLTILVDATGQIKEVIIGPNRETPSYLELIKKELLQKFKNYTPHNSNYKIDAITGATFTSTAVIEGVLSSLSLFSSKVLYKSSEPHLYSYSLLKLDITTVLSIVIFFIFVAISVNSKIIYRFRYIYLSLVIIVIGFILKRFLSIGDILRLISIQLPASSFLPLWLIFTLGIIIITIIWGRIYCWHICPYGAIQELIIFWKKRPLTLPKKITTKLGNIKFILLGASSFFVGYNYNFSFISFEPFSLMFRPVEWLKGIKEEPIAFIIIVGTIVLGIFIYRVWCSFFCPLGALFNLVSYFSVRSQTKGCKKECDLSYTNDKFYCIKCNTNRGITLKQ